MNQVDLNGLNKSYSILSFLGTRVSYFDMKGWLFLSEKVVLLNAFFNMQAILFLPAWLHYILSQKSSNTR